MNNKSVFKNFIDNHILEYPIVYFRQDYTRSKMAVLDHIFFVIGNGLEFKNGYPLCNNSNHKMIKYDKVDIDEFFENKDKVYLLNIWSFDDGSTVNQYIKENNIDFDDISIKKFSNQKVIYTYDVDFAMKWNKNAKKFNKSRGLFEHYLVYFQRFDSYYFTFFNEECFYPIHKKYSLINQIKNQPVIQKETLKYALELLEYAKNFYENKNDMKELNKINKLIIEMKGLQNEKNHNL